MPAKATPAPSPYAALADELGALKKEQNLLLAPFALKKPRMEAIEKELREACPAAADTAWTAHGVCFDVILGPRAEWRVVSIPKLIKRIGQKAFNAIASVALKDLEADTLDAVAHKERIGPRTLKTIEKGTAA